MSHSGDWAYANGELNVRPASCATWRVYLVAEGVDGDVLLTSTSALPCTTIQGTTDATVSIPTRTKSRVVVWDSAGNRILSLQSKAYNGL
ncbi:hypothetical protein [Actinoplanes sp. NPDC049265]|uniref:hypothetical protein n=1 Tax=Actinoplanes sp. NPDC049265 TaxID=3363902 RepID=UPI0037114546